MSGSLTIYRFSFGPWNIHEGADPFAPLCESFTVLMKKLNFTKTLVLKAYSFMTMTLFLYIDELKLCAHNRVKYLPNIY